MRSNNKLLSAIASADTTILQRMLGASNKEKPLMFVRKNEPETVESDLMIVEGDAHFIGDPDELFVLRNANNPGLKSEYTHAEIESLFELSFKGYGMAYLLASPDDYTAAGHVLNIVLYQKDPGSNTGSMKKLAMQYKRITDWAQEKKLPCYRPLSSAAEIAIDRKHAKQGSSISTT